MRHVPLDSARDALATRGERSLTEQADDATGASRWPKAKFVVRSDRTVFSLVDLPASDTKALDHAPQTDVVDAVHGGLLTKEEACWRYALTMDEYLSWQIAVERFGRAGLNARRAQNDRRADRTAT